MSASRAIWTSPGWPVDGLRTRLDPVEEAPGPPDWGGEEVYRELVEEMNEGAATVDSAGLVQYCNHQFARLVGLPIDEVLGFPFVNRLSPGHRSAFEAFLADPLRATAAGEFTLRQPCGEELHVRISAARIHGPAQLLGLVVVDLTEPIRAAHALQESQEQLQRVLDASHDGFWEIDVTSRTGFRSARCSQIVGLPAVETSFDMRWMERIHPEDRPRVEGVLADVKDGKLDRFSFEYRTRFPEDQWRWVLVRGTVTVRDVWGRPVRAAGSASDIDAQRRAEEARRRAEEQLQQSQRLEAIGQLAGGIAHDFRNLLAVILSGTDSALEGLPDPGPLREIVEDLRTAAEKGQVLTQQLLAFSRKQELKPRALDLNGVVRETERILRRLVGGRIRMKVELQPGLEPIFADPVQVQQVVMNLALNARDAMPDGGVLSIRTCAASASEGCECHVTGPRNCPCAVLAVEDTGVGMDDATRARVFEPFFTTKPEGKGTGLGLSTVFGIVKQSGGVVRVTSAPGKGARFDVLLPRASVVAGAREPSPVAGA